MIVEMGQFSFTSGTDIQVSRIHTYIHTYFTTYLLLYTNMNACMLLFMHTYIHENSSFTKIICSIRLCPLQSTFRPPVRSEYQTAVNYKTRFRQYISNVNDRALYSLACVIDGTCPVNFRDQLTEGQV